MAKKWIQKAIKHPGALRAKAHAKKGQKIPEKTLDKLAKKPGKTGKQARLAKELRLFHK